MKQTKLVKEVYKACIEHNAEKLRALQLAEFKKIFKHRAHGKAVNIPKFTVL
jgi:hypothetical protein